MNIGYDGLATKPYRRAAPDEPETALMIKRSMTINGHRTSVSLESLFWEQLVRLATKRGSSLAALVAEIDTERSRMLLAGQSGGGLSSAIRLYVLRQVLAEAGEQSGKGTGQAPIRLAKPRQRGL